MQKCNGDGRMKNAPAQHGLAGALARRAPRGRRGNQAAYEAGLGGTAGAAGGALKLAIRDASFCLAAFR